jgi:hypothetical protein
MYSPGGQNGLDPDPELVFLEKDHILDYGLENDFIQRHDLAVMVRHLFMRDLDLTRCDQGLSSYIRMFRPQLSDSASKSVDDPGMYWKTLMQIVCLVSHHIYYHYYLFGIKGEHVNMATRAKSY